MAEELLVEIVTPEEMVFSDTVEMVTIPGGDGEFGVLIGHAPILSTVNAGELNITKGNRKTYYAVGKGYAEVTAKKVTLLLEKVVKASNIDKDAARRELSEAEADLSRMTREDAGYSEVLEKLRMAEAKLKAADKA
ncbi:MAG: ATP synthase F1 subunit epsilon [Deltaproteobacteria bacterium]|jgi:F-type H+-transporting ATPase subunit epsilon|nr:ATP synthase F1 subunit epsilon [Deltaproteobacteria bacterium]MBN2686683.1 ATP synthase F1 subunit epsilon [Deltaproteobacteria bacterium]